MIAKVILVTAALLDWSASPDVGDTTAQWQTPSGASCELSLSPQAVAMVTGIEDNHLTMGRYAEEGVVSSTGFSPDTRLRQITPPVGLDYNTFLPEPPRSDTLDRCIAALYKAASGIVLSKK